MSSRSPAIRFVWLTLFLDAVGFSLLIPVGPALVQSLMKSGGLGTGSETEAAPVYSWLLITFQLFAFAFSPLMGVLSDRFGRRPVILISLAGSALDFFAQALAPNLLIFFVTRAINGISGSNIGVCTAYVADVTPPEKRAASLGALFAAFGVGFTFGPVIGGWIGGGGAGAGITQWLSSVGMPGDEHAIHLRLPFLLAGIITLANWLYGYFVLPESLPREKRSASIHWGRTNPFGSLAWLTKYPTVFGLATALFLLNAAQFCLHATWAYSMQHRFKWTTQEVGNSMLVVGIMSMIVQGGLVRQIVPRLGDRRSMLFGVCVTVCAFVGYGLAPASWVVYAVIVTCAVGGIAGPAVQSIITKSVRPDEQGTVQGALASVGSIAGIFGPGVGGYAFAYFTSPTAPVQLAGAPFLASALMCIGGVTLAAFATAKMARPIPSIVTSGDSSAPTPSE